MCPKDLFGKWNETVFISVRYIFFFCPLPLPHPYYLWKSLFWICVLSKGVWHEKGRGLRTQCWGLALVKITDGVHVDNNLRSSNLMLAASFDRHSVFPLLWPVLSPELFLEWMGQLLTANLGDLRTERTLGPGHISACHPEAWNQTLLSTEHSVPSRDIFSSSAMTVFNSGTDPSSHVLQHICL